MGESNEKTVLVTCGNSDGSVFAGRLRERGLQWWWSSGGKREPACIYVFLYQEYAVRVGRGSQQGWVVLRLVKVEWGIAESR